jgi:hypothetical protein
MIRLRPIQPAAYRHNTRFLPLWGKMSLLPLRRRLFTDALDQALLTPTDP